MSNRIVRTLVLVAVCALAACTAPKTAMNGPVRIVSLDRPAVTVMKAFVDEGWGFDSLDSDGEDTSSIVGLRDDGRNLCVAVYLCNRQAAKESARHVYGRELSRRNTERALGGCDDFRRSIWDDTPPTQCKHDVFDQGGRRWNVVVGRALADGEPIIVESAHSGFAQHGVRVVALPLASDRPEGLRAVTTDVVNTLAALTRNPA